MWSRRVLLAAFLLVPVLPNPALAGSIRLGPTSADIATIFCCDSGATIVDKDGNERPARVGETVRKGETVKTGHGGKVELALPDKSVIRLGAKATLELDDFVLQPRQGETSWVRYVFKLLGGAIQATAPDETVYRLGCRLGGTCPMVGIRGTEFVVSVPDDDALDTDISMLSGWAELGVVDYRSLPDRYFPDPRQKSVETLDELAVLAEVTPSISYFDLLGVSHPIELQTGYWTRFSSSGGVADPQIGLAPSQAGIDFTCTVPEQSSWELWLIGLAALAGVRVARRDPQADARPRLTRLSSHR
jgi:hypothetical protein